MYYEIQDFVIVSSNTMIELLFCSDYQKAVTEAINRIMDLADYVPKMKLFVYANHIEIREPTGTIYFEELRNYDSTEDLEEVVIGEL